MPPMQPFKPFPPPERVEKRVKLPLSTPLKVILALKLVSVLFVMGTAILVIVSLNAAHPTAVMPAELIRKLANLALYATIASFVELAGIAGTWSMKRWGVYTLMGFSFINIALRASAHDNVSAAFAGITTLVVAMMIAPRWSDFD